MKQLDNLRHLASLLDLHLGVHARKIILEGNEKLTRRTNESDWTAWITGVERRVNLLSVGRSDRDLLIKACTQNAGTDPSVSEKR